MDNEIRKTIEAIHAGPHGAVLICTGGGAAAIEWLLAVPGASATVLEALVPYSREALAALIGTERGQSTSPETARLMADRAYERARRWARDAARPVIGIACTAALATNYPKRGEHRAVVAVRDAGHLTLHTLTLAKGARDRAGEEEVVSRLLLCALAEACRVSPAFAAELLPGESVTVEREDRVSPVARLLRGDFEWLLVLLDGQMVPNGSPDGALFPGAFHPLHAGHRRLAAAVSKLLQRPVVFEISAENVDKPPLAEAEAQRRLQQFEGFAPVLLTRAPTFRRKAELFPGSTFVIGYDTLERLFAPRYYHGEPEMRAALAAMRSAGTRFVVAGRRRDERFLTLDDFSIPEDLRAMFTAVPPPLFRSDVSSTALRAAREKSQPEGGQTADDPE
jgi:cytidylyltransferase-like protein/competence-damaged protein